MIQKLTDQLVVLFVQGGQPEPLVATFKGIEEGLVFLESPEGGNTHVVPVVAVSYIGLESEAAAVMEKAKFDEPKADDKSED